jgi:hypothetical protein
MEGKKPMPGTDIEPMPASKTPASKTPASKTPAEKKPTEKKPASQDDLVADIDRTRQELAATIDAISDRLNPANVAHRTVERVRERIAQVDHQPAVRGLQRRERVVRAGGPTFGGVKGPVLVEVDGELGDLVTQRLGDVRIVANADELQPQVFQVLLLEPDHGLVVVLDGSFVLGDELPLGPRGRAAMEGDRDAVKRAAAAQLSHGHDQAVL